MEMATSTPQQLLRRRLSTAHGSGRRITTPGTPGMLTPNDDASEKEQARRRRASRGAVQQLTRDLAGVSIDDKENQPGNGDAPRELNKEQLLLLYNNCIRLAAENKINDKNTWNLGLIDHLSDLVKPSLHADEQVNFQVASCTLDAGVKIYSARVDSYEKIAYMALKGCTGTDDTGDVSEQLGEEDPVGATRRSRSTGHSFDPKETLESDVKNINAKGTDNSLGLNPLFQKMSAQFDAGGPQGLLMNSLSVHNGCRVVFDSAEVPDERMAGCTGPPASSEDQADVQLSLPLPPPPSRGSCITPSLDAIIALLGTPVPHDQPQQAASLVQQVAGSCAAFDGTGDGSRVQHDGAAADAGDESHVFSGLGDDMLQDSEDELLPGDDFADDFLGVDGDMDPAASWHDEGGDSHQDGSGVWQDAVGTARLARGAAADAPLHVGLVSAMEAAQQLLQGVEMGDMGRKGWAGPSFWKFRRGGSSSTATPTASTTTKASTGRKRGKVQLLDFENLPELCDDAIELAEEEDITLKTMTAVNTLLPEDHHYDAASLGRLFLRPHLNIAMQPQQHTTGAQEGDSGDEGMAGDMQDWGAGFDDGGALDEAGDWQDEPADGSGALQLVDEPIRPGRLQVSFARQAKQVDVRALKEVLWRQLQRLHPSSLPPSQQPPPLSFNNLLSTVPSVNPAGALHDLSVHLCFICLLHLANEKGLVLEGRADMADLTIRGSLA